MIIKFKNKFKLFLDKYKEDLRVNSQKLLNAIGPFIMIPLNDADFEYHDPNIKYNFDDFINFVNFVKSDIKIGYNRKRRRI